MDCQWLCFFIDWSWDIRHEEKMDNEEDCGHVIRVGDSVKEKGNLPKRTPLDVSQQKPFNIQ